jgi:maltooligosyltrehalose trehalohydrolase
VKSFNDAYVFDGIWSDHRKRIFGNKTTGIPGHKFVVFIQNHDQVGNRMKGDRLTSLVNFEILKVAAGAMLVSPFIPMLFMGEEYAETNPFLYFTSHTDKELIRLVREGRRKEFKAFMDQGEVPDPHDVQTFEASKLNWDHRNERQEQMFAYYRQLIHLRKTIPALRNTSRENMTARQVDDRNVLYLVRKLDDQLLVSILNFESAEVKVTLPEISDSRLKLLLNSADTTWGGPGHRPPAFSEIPPQSITIWTTKKA